MYVVGIKIRDTQEHARLGRMQGASKQQHHNTTRTRPRRATIPPRIPLHRNPAERKGRKAHLLPLRRGRQVRHPVPPQVLRAPDAGILELVERARRVGDLGPVLEPGFEGDRVELHCEEHGGRGFLG